jgi:hypothetical protein
MADIIPFPNSNALLRATPLDVREVMVGGVRVLRKNWVDADGNAIAAFDLAVERLPAAVNRLLEPLKIRETPPPFALQEPGAGPHTGSVPGVHSPDRRR